MFDRKWLSTAVFLVLGLAGTREAQAQLQVPQAEVGLASQRLIKTIETGVTAALERGEGVGLGVALVEGGRVVWARGFGLADVAAGRPIELDTRFNVGSVSKTLTSWGVMKLVEAGKVELDQPVNTYLKSWKLPDGAEHPASEVTVRRLLNHTAGLSIEGYPGVAAEQPGELKLSTTAECLQGQGACAEHGALVIERAPGAGFKYSGGGYTLLQLMIEDVSGKPFADYMQSEVFAPLGMEHTEFGWSETIAEHIATPHGAEREPLAQRLFSELAAAGCCTTPLDLGRFVAASIRSVKREPVGRGVLERSTVEATWSPTVAADRGGQYGLGVTVLPGPGGDVKLNHNGSNTGWKAMFMSIPARGRGIVLMVNSDSTSLAELALQAWEGGY